MTGTDLRTLRAQWQMTQAELADLLGYSPHTISDIERGKKHVTLMLEKHLRAVQALRQIHESTRGFLQPHAIDNEYKVWLAEAQRFLR